jgi:hypothetical protein
MPTVLIRDEKPVGNLEGQTVLENVPQRIKLRDLIRTRVRDEVARANLAPKVLFWSLVKPVDAEVTLNGYQMRNKNVINWEAQAAAAEKAFQRNGFFVLVGDRQIVDLDDELDLTGEADIRFVRLVPLVGG